VTGPAANPPRLFPASEEIRRIAALIASEVCTWPRVKSKRMFGMLSLYRGAHIFAALPDTRAFFSGQCLIFKLHDVDGRLDLKLTNDPRVNRSGGIGKRWFGYEMDTPTDIHGALDWLGEAYEQAKGIKATPRPKAKKRST
jgi:hypothetical protein